MGNCGGRDAAGEATALRKPIVPGESIPSIDVTLGVTPGAMASYTKTVNMAARIKNKKVIIVGLPGGFTPHCPTVPGYVQMQHQLKAKGVAEVLFLDLNEGAVLHLWKNDWCPPTARIQMKDGCIRVDENPDSEGSLIKFGVDGTSAFTKAIGMWMPPPKLNGQDRFPGFWDGDGYWQVQGVRGHTRCKQFALVCDDGAVKHVEVSEATDDPTAKTRVEKILTLL